MENTEILNTEADLAADYIEGLLDIADLDGDIEMTIKNNRPVISIVSENKKELEPLVGEDGEALVALQELTRLSVNEQLQERSSLLLDINNWREERVEELKKIAKEKAEMLGENPVHLNPMNSFERKIIHDIIAELGAFSHSEGLGKKRHIVITKEEVVEEENTSTDSE